MEIDSPKERTSDFVPSVQSSVDAFAQRVSEAASPSVLAPGTVLPPQFTKTILELKPELAACVGRSMEDALYFYGASPDESRLISSLFEKEEMFKNFRFFVEDGRYFGYYRYSHADDGITDRFRYFHDVVRHPDWGMHISAHLVSRMGDDGIFIPLDHQRIEYDLTIRHELDHLVRHLLAILRDFNNSGQFALQTALNPLSHKKAELNAFYHQANLAIRLKGFGVDVTWNDILEHHTGWSLSIGEVSEDYRGVVDHVRSIIVTRNVFYNALSAKYGHNPSASNSYSSIARDGYRIFDGFCKALLKGFDSIGSETEMETFLSYVGNMGTNIPATAVGVETFLSRIWNPPASVFALPSYSAFIAEFRNSFER